MTRTKQAVMSPSKFKNFSIALMGKIKELPEDMRFEGAKFLDTRYQEVVTCSVDELVITLRDEVLHKLDMMTLPDGVQIHLTLNVGFPNEAAEN